MNDNEAECSNVNLLFLKFVFEKHERLNCNLSNDKNSNEIGFG